MDNFQQELNACRSYARRGETLARDSFNELKSSIAEEKQNLRNADSKQRNNRLADERIFGNQLDKINQLELDVEDGIKKLDQRPDDFTIVLYGRTAAGKSTLMEILTRGNGGSMGQGSQDTTREPRDYSWNGLKIWDLPGVSSYSGKFNAIALEKAKIADLAIFMISDDAVQKDEADRLKDLMQLGKPVLGILNVKQSLTSERNNPKRRLDIKQIEKKIGDTQRLKEIEGQFKRFAPDGRFENIKFISAHLLAAFVAQQENDQSLRQLSNFAAVEDFIIEKVSTDGKFFSFKNYTDVVARPLDQSIAMFYNNSAATSGTYNTWVDTLNEFIDWRQSYITEVQNSIEAFKKDLRSQFRRVIDDFVDEYYDSSSPEGPWRTRIERMNIPGQCKDFISNESDKVRSRLRRFNDRLKDSIRGDSFNAGAVRTDVGSLPYTDLTDYGDGLRTGALAIGLLTPFAPLAIGMGIVSFLFESRSSKIRKQKDKMRAALGENRDAMIPKIESQLYDIVNDGIFAKQINPFGQRLDERQELLWEVAVAQEKIADALNSKYKNLNFNLLVEALKYVGNPRGLGSIFTVRDFGKELVVFSTSGMLDWVRNDITTRGLLEKELRTFEVRDDKFFDDVNDKIRRFEFSKKLRQQILNSPTGEG